MKHEKFLKECNNFILVSAEMKKIKMVAALGQVFKQVLLQKDILGQKNSFSMCHSLNKKFL